MLTIEVKRQEGAYFEPYITDHEHGCVVTFHTDDITKEGASFLAQAYTSQARRWAPRPLDAPRGARIPVVMDRRTDLPDGVLIVVDDRPGLIKYTVDADLITARGAALIARAQTDRSPDWERTPAHRPTRLSAV